MLYESLILNIQFQLLWAALEVFMPQPRTSLVPSSLRLNICLRLDLSK